MAVLATQMVVTMGGSRPHATAAVRVGWALLPAKRGARGFGGGRVNRRLLICRYPLLRVRCFGATENLSHAGEALSELLGRNWMLPDPGAKINQISLVPDAHGQQGADFSVASFVNNSCPSLDGGFRGGGGRRPCFYVVRDDLLHPLLNGNKARKLDAVMPILQEHSVTDVVTCGGCQSAHAAAVAVACAERGMRSHLLLRGEQPEILTGYNLVSSMYGDVTYIARSAYAKREHMLRAHASVIAGDGGSIMWLDDIFDKSPADQKPAARLLGLCDCTYVPSVGGIRTSSRKIVIISEGAGDVLGLLGVIRLVKYLSQADLFGKEQKITIVLDAGTGTTAVGLGIGAICLGLPWKIVAVMLADSIEGYIRQEKCLISDFKRICESEYVGLALNGFDGGIIHWVERIHPRRFGNVRKGEIEVCRRIAKQTGILVDPVYTLAAWEQALCLSAEAGCGTNVVMLHTGGTLGMFGLAQRYKSFFDEA